jgi:hypothetical protein
MQKPVCCCHDLQPESAPLPSVFRVVIMRIGFFVVGSRY